MKDKPDKQETKYNPEYFVTDLEGILSRLMGRIEVMGEIEFSLKQTSQIAGMFLGISATFGKSYEVLKKWGFLA